MTTTSIFSQQHMEEWFSPMPSQAAGIADKLCPTFVSCDATNKTATLAFSVKPWQLNPQNVLHGGFTATALYFSMELLAGYFAQTADISTLSSNITYQKPIFAGDVFHVVVRVVGENNGTFHIQGDASLPNKGVLAASMTAIYSTEKGGVL